MPLMEEGLTARYGGQTFVSSTDFTPSPARRHPLPKEEGDNTER